MPGTCFLSFRSAEPCSAEALPVTPHAEHGSALQVTPQPVIIWYCAQAQKRREFPPFLCLMETLDYSASTTVPLTGSVPSGDVGSTTFTVSTDPSGHTIWKLLPGCRVENGKPLCAR